VILGITIVDDNNGDDDTSGGGGEGKIGVFPLFA
jgi:hypothetical protein